MRACIYFMWSFIILCVHQQHSAERIKVKFFLLIEYVCVCVCCQGLKTKGKSVVDPELIIEFGERTFRLSHSLCLNFKSEGYYMAQCNLPTKKDEWWWWPIIIYVEWDTASFPNGTTEVDLFWWKGSHYTRPVFLN